MLESSTLATAAHKNLVRHIGQLERETATKTIMMFSIGPTYIDFDLANPITYDGGYSKMKRMLDKQAGLEGNQFHN